MNLIATAVTGVETADLSTPLGALSEFYSAFNTRDLEKMRGNWHQLECVLDNPLGHVSQASV